MLHGKRVPCVKGSVELDGPLLHCRRLRPAIYLSVLLVMLHAHHRGRVAVHADGTHLSGVAVILSIGVATAHWVAIVRLLNGL